MGLPQSFTLSSFLNAKAVATTTQRTMKTFIFLRTVNRRSLLCQMISLRLKISMKEEQIRVFISTHSPVSPH